MAFSPPSDVMAVDEPPPEPDSAPTSHGYPSEEEDDMAVDDDDEAPPKHDFAPTSHGSPSLEENDVWEVDPPPPSRGGGGGGADARHWSAEVEQMKSSLDCQETLLKMCRKYGISEEKYRPLCPEDGWGGPCKTPPEGSVCVYKVMLEVGVRFPMHDFYTKILRYYRIAPSQLTPNAWRYLAGFVLVCDGAGVTPTVPIFRYYFKLTAAPGPSKLQGWYSFVPHSTMGRRLFSRAESYRPHEGWKKSFFFLESRSAETAWRCPTRWGAPPSQDSHKAPPVLEEAAMEAIKKLDTHRGRSLQSVLSGCDRLPVLPTPELAPVKEGRPTSPPRKYRAMSSIVDRPPQQLGVAMGMASSSSPPPELVTPEPDPGSLVRADSRDRGRQQHSASQMLMDTFEAMRRTEEDLHRVMDELQEEKSMHAADVAQLNEELGAVKAGHTAQVARLSEKVDGLEAAKAESEAKVRRLMQELQTEKTKASQLAEDFRVVEAKHAAEVKALNDEWQLKVTDAQLQSGAIIGAALRETCSAVVKTIQDHLVASYPSIEPAMQTLPPGFPPPHQALQEPVTTLPFSFFHQTTKEEVETREDTEGRTRQIMQDLMMTRCPSIDPAILTSVAFPPGFPPHEAPGRQ